MRSLFAPFGFAFALCFIGCSGSDDAGNGAVFDVHGVGAPCESSADCLAPLFCNSDPVKHLGASTHPDESALHGHGARLRGHQRDWRRLF